MFTDKAIQIKDSILQRLPFFGGQGHVIETGEQRCKIVITDNADNWFYIDYAEGNGAIEFEPDERPGVLLIETTVNYKLVGRVSGLDRGNVVAAVVAVLLKNKVNPTNATMDSETVFFEETDGDEMKKDMELFKILFTHIKSRQYNDNCINQVCTSC